MPRKRFPIDQIITKLREAEVRISRGETIAQACKAIEVTEQTYYRWRKQYGGLKSDQAKRLKDLEKENLRLRGVVADLSLDNAILKEASKGNY
jgi:putative transposase